jgi:drug/metabolite transporter (DMT)-like permease
MNWITAGFLMFFCSVVQYLLVRRAVLLKTPSQFTNLAMFLVPLGVYGLWAYATGVSLSVSPYQFLILAVLAFFFSYLGNVFSLKSIEYAPNPGYSLVLSKSYVVFTTLAAIPLFGSSLTPKAAAAILLIVACSALISIDRKKDVQPSHVRPSWLPLAFGAFFCWGMLSITSKYLLTIGVNVFARLIYSMAMVNLLIAGEMVMKKVRVKMLTAPQSVNLLIIGIMSAGFNYGMQQGFVTAPNIGYINAMNASSIGLVVVGSAIFFRDDLSLRKLIGVAGVIAGLILLVL